MFTASLVAMVTLIFAMSGPAAASDDYYDPPFGNYYSVPGTAPTYIYRFPNSAYPTLAYPSTAYPYEAYPDAGVSEARKSRCKVICTLYSGGICIERGRTPHCGTP